MTEQTPPAKSRFSGRALLLILGTLVVIAVVASQNKPATRTPSSGGGSPADTYVSDYGGSRAVYTQILTDTSCAMLQTTFDRAAGNNDTAEPGSAEAQWTTGYMVAADTRMQAIGCY